MSYEILNNVPIPRRKYDVANRPMNIARATALKAGEMYYQGNPCKLGHSGKRITKDAQCVECRSSTRKKKRTKERTRGWELKKCFGMTIEQYNEILAKQDFVCAICKQPETTLSNYGTPKQLAVDHCHETGKIRGLLCLTCNVGIGYLKHDPIRLRQAALYCDRA